MSTSSSTSSSPSGTSRRANTPQIRRATRESQIAQFAAAAVQRAAQRAQERRLPLTTIADGKLLRVAPDGTQTMLKKIAPDVPVQKGAKVSLRKVSQQ